MGRHERRASIHEYRREARGAHLITHLIAASDVPDSGLLHNALMFWRSQIQRRRPYCPICKSNYADPDVFPEMYLFSALPGGTSASVTAFCSECTDIAEIERHAVRILRQIIPAGEFIDPR